MRKITELHFKLSLLFLIVMPIWVSVKWINIIIVGGLIILDLLFLINKNHNKKRIDIIDIMIFLLPLYYLIPYILKISVNSISSKIFYIFMEFGLSLTIIVLRRYLDKEKRNRILISLIMIGIIYFFVSFIYQAFPKVLTPIGITSYFGDTYFNSIDRFYGTLDYCNMSALFFLICFFISLFKIKDDEYNKYIYYFALFINMLGFLITYSKMLTIDFILVSITLILYLVIRKKKVLLSSFITILVALIFPMIISVNYSRLFLINLNLFIYIFVVLLAFILFVIVIKFIEFISSKISIGVYLVFIFETIIIGCFIINPVAAPLKINNVASKNDYIISDFILESDNKYDLELDIEYNSKSNIKILLCGLYVDNHFIPNEEIITSFDENEDIKYTINANSLYEYYYIKIKNINKKTDIVINNLKINGEEYLFNSKIIPYQFIHQLELLKYDRESATSRLLYYKDSLKMLKDYDYVLGHGYQSFAELKNNYAIRYNELDPHSYIFQLWLDTGLYGVIYVILLIIIGLYYMYKYRKCDDKILFFIIFALCMVVLPFDLIYTSIYMKFLLLLFFVLLNDKTKNILN